MTKICMIVQDKMVKGGIAAVISGYYGSTLEQDFDITYVESYKDGSKLSKFFKALSGYFNFIKCLIFNKPDIVHIHSSFGASFYRKIPFIYMASWAKIPILNHVHGADFNVFYTNATHKKKNLIKKVYNKCTKFIALSNEWKENLSKIVSEDKIVIIENYSVINEQAFEQRLNRDCNNTVLFLGELGPRKCCYDIPDVVEKVVTKIPNVKFVFAGDGIGKDHIREAIKEKGLFNNIDLPGWVRGEQKDELLKQADIFFLPSYNEGMPMSILDSMGYGLPIISTLVGGIPNIVYNDKNGYLFEPGDIEDFSNAIVDLLTNSEKRINFAKASFQIANDKYSLDCHIEKLKSVYKSMLHK